MSNLLKMSLALEDDHLKRRVNAAAVLRAQQVQNKTGVEGMFAKMILADVSRQWPDFILRVASDAHVQDALSLAPDNSNIYATNVTDAQIQSLVDSALAQNAKKYVPEVEGGTDS